MPATRRSPPAKLHRELLDYALALHGAWEDHPWGEDVAKVAKKVFMFGGVSDGSSERHAISVKLPHNAGAALMLKCASSTGYGLGRAGWVSIDLAAADCPPRAVLEDWIDESYRAVAPKKLIAEHDATVAKPSQTRARATRRKS